jgi:hypothetical protein
MIEWQRNADGALKFDEKITREKIHPLHSRTNCVGRNCGAFFLIEYNAGRLQLVLRPLQSV